MLYINVSTSEFVGWPSKGVVGKASSQNFEKDVTGELKGDGTRMHVIFDHYCEYSIKK